MFKFLVLSLCAGLAHAETKVELNGWLGIVNKGDHSASFYNLETGELKTVATGQLPHEIVGRNGRAYISNYGSNHVRSISTKDNPGNTITAVDLSGVEPKAHTFSLGEGRCGPHGLALSKDGKRLYVTCEVRQELFVVDTESEKVLERIPTNQPGSHMVAISSDEKWAYVVNFWSGTVSCIDLSKKELVRQIMVGRISEGLALSPDDQFLYVTRVEEGELFKIHTPTFEILKRRPFAKESSPIRAEVLPSGKVLVNFTGDRMLRVLEPEDLSTFKEFEVGHQPIGLAAFGDHRAYVANMKDNNISVINLDTMRAERAISVGSLPDGIAVISP